MFSMIQYKSTVAAVSAWVLRVLKCEMLCRPVLIMPICIRQRQTSSQKLKSSVSIQLLRIYCHLQQVQCLLYGNLQAETWLRNVLGCDILSVDVKKASSILINTLWKETEAGAGAVQARCSWCFLNWDSSCLNLQRFQAPKRLAEHLVPVFSSAL